jgi:hypothetical protein
MSMIIGRAVLVAALFPLVTGSVSNWLAQPVDGNGSREVLVLDLDGNGVCVTSRSQGVIFRFNPRESAIRTPWVCARRPDPFFAVDVTKNGRIDGSWELLGGMLGPHHAIRYLREMDGARLNEGQIRFGSDGKIDIRDSIFRSLILWTDANHNGTSEEMELQSAEYAGVISISLQEETLAVSERSNTALKGKVNVLMELNGQAARRAAFIISIPDPKGNGRPNSWQPTW